MAEPVPTLRSPDSNTSIDAAFVRLPRECYSRHDGGNVPTGIPEPEKPVRAPNLWVELDPHLACKDPTLLAIHRYWLDKRGDRLFPSRADIDPVDLAPHLGNLVLIDVEQEPLRLRYRLIGTSITRAMDRDSTGKYYDEIYAEPLLGQIYASFRWMIEHRRPLRTFGEAFYPDRNFYEYETLNLPLAADGRRIDMVLGGLVFHPVDRRLPP